MNQQRGTVTTMAFTPDTSHLFVGDSSGALIAYSTSTWEIHKVWPKAHKGNGVSLIRIHPSGKLAVTLGTELNMQLWNLIRGTCVNTTNLKGVTELGRIVDCLEWNPSGDYFAITGAKVVQIWNTRTAVCERSFSMPNQPTSLAWISEKVLAVGLSSGEILFRKNVDGGEENETKEQKIHEKRVKAMSLQMPYLATISSDGEVAISELLFEQKFGKFNKLAKTNVGCRPTCVTLLDKSTFASFKLEEQDGDQDEAEDGESGSEQEGDEDSDEDAPETLVPVRKGNLAKGTVEVIEEDDEEDEDEDVAAPPPKKNRKSVPGQFVMATPVKKVAKQVNKIHQKQPVVSASAKKSKNQARKEKKRMNSTIG